MNGIPAGRLNKGIILPLVFIAVVAAGFVLKVTSEIVLMIIISIFLACIMSPMVSVLEKIRIPRIIAIILAGCFIVGGFAVIGLVLFSSGKMILGRYPIYEMRLIEIYRWLGRFFELTYNEKMGFFDNLWSHFTIRNNIRQLTISLSNSSIVFLKNAFMVALYSIFLLIEAGSFKLKIALAFENKISDRIRTICSSVAREVTRYLSVKFFISLVTGLIVGLGLQIIGVEFAPVWAVVQFILNFIPIIGSTAIGAVVTLFALLQFWPEPAPVIAAGMLMLLSNMVIGTIMEPRIMGYNLGISPVAVLLSLSLWGWMWGFAGMVLAVPMTVIIKIVCENVPELKPVSILIGSKRYAEAKHK